jgi:hypothetical protein
VSVLVRNNGHAWPAWVWTSGPINNEADISELARTYPYPLRFMTNSPSIEAIAREAAAAVEPGRVEVVLVR